MPIYAYRCTSCGHAKDVLRKLSDPALTECPSCGASTFAKQVTAAGFQLKGSGWYATDFKSSGGAKKPDEAGNGKDAAAPADKPGEKTVDKSAEPAKTVASDSGGKTTAATSGGEPKASASAGGTAERAGH